MFITRFPPLRLGFLHLLSIIISVVCMCGVHVWVPVCHTAQGQLCGVCSLLFPYLGNPVARFDFTHLVCFAGPRQGPYRALAGFEFPVCPS